MSSLTVKTTSIYVIEVDKSKFIALLFPIKNDESFKSQIVLLKEENKGASHFCFAYRNEDSERMSDDGEPHGTAGLPLLNLLKNENLSDCALVVVRYFGGHKLGAGRLLRTYVKAGKGAISAGEKYEQIPGIKLKAAFDYSQWEIIKGKQVVLRDEIIKMDYNVKVEVTLLLAEERLTSLIDYLDSDDFIITREPANILRKVEVV
ncbi:MAG TPA: YigZ family protein [Bacilli bacterium]|nr:YigZ family protein [Bacilli bacterium]